MSFLGFSGASYPDVVGTLLQQKFLQREFEEGLESTLAYRMVADQDTVPTGIGETLTRTRTSRLVPIDTPISGYDRATLDNGLTPKDYSIERYTFSVKQYGDTQDLNLMQNAAQLADDFLKKTRNGGTQAAQSLDRIARKALFNAYLGGSTRVTADVTNTPVTNNVAMPATIANNAAANVPVDDIRGFQKLIVSGELTDVSGTNFLSSKVTTPAGTVLAIKVNSATAYIYNNGYNAASLTSTPGAIPGYVNITNLSGSTWTLTASTTSVSGDAITANNGPAIYRAGARRQMQDITSTDLVTLSLFEDAVVGLRDNGVPTKPDGTYHVVCDNTTIRQLFADPRFQAMYQGQGKQAQEYRDGQIIQLLGMTFIPTTEAYVQTAPLTNGPRIRRPIVCGGECLIEGDFEGMETFMSNLGFNPDDLGVAMVNGVLAMVRPPLDRLRQNIAISWAWVGDFAVPSDVTTDTTIIPTASNAMFKRAAVIEHAG